ncbi:MAG TPA: flagellar M-ring protein FliF [Firmicutes bacterium]|nr:flagellar M-ring protein FliF [Bacillota bacterium]
MKNILESIKETWGKLSRPMQIGMGIFVLGVFISLVLLALFSRTEYRVLFAGLSGDDAGAVVSALQERGVQYKLAENGTTVLVPQNQVDEMRISLATAGMPTGGVVGFEIFNATRLGETEADRQLRFQWALQGELTRTIRQINEIADARVHIVLPKRSLFITETQAATAAVSLQLKPGAQLSKGQVKAIAYLVSTSVEGLSPENVTIVDTRGTVLTAPALNGVGGVLAERFEMQWLYEQQLESSIVAMLERIYGFGNVVARVNANLNFSRLEEYSEVYHPANRGEGLTRSVQSYEESYRSTTGGQAGVPGVDANIPGYVFPEQGEGLTEWDRTEGTTNYELNKTETHAVIPPGEVNNLSVSVWINGELDPNQIASIEESVRLATGLKADRGDNIYVASVPFEDTPFLTDVMPPEIKPVLPVHWIVLAAVVLLALLALVVLRRRYPIRPEEVPVAAGLDVVVDDDYELKSQELSPEELERLGMRKAIQKMAEEKPEEVALLMKTWLTED